MIFKIRYQLLGGHVHAIVWAGKNFAALGNCGKLVMREEEWMIFHDVITAATREEILDPASVQVIVEEKV